MEKFNSIKLAMKGPQALVLSIGNQNNSGTDDTVHMMPNTVHMINDRVTSIEILELLKLLLQGLIPFIVLYVYILFIIMYYTKYNNIIHV